MASGFYVVVYRIFIGPNNLSLEAWKTIRTAFNFSEGLLYTATVYTENINKGIVQPTD
jgi:hypothetical protein